MFVRLPTFLPKRAISQERLQYKAHGQKWWVGVSVAEVLGSAACLSHIGNIIQPCKALCALPICSQPLYRLVESCERHAYLQGQG